MRSKDYDDILANWTPAQLATAFDQEVQLFEKLVGFTPTHVIGHKQISLNSKIVRHIADYCVKNNCYARRGERTTTLKHATLKADETPQGLNIGRTVDAILGFRYGSPSDMYLAYKQDLTALRQSSLRATARILKPEEISTPIWSRSRAEMCGLPVMSEHFSVRIRFRTHIQCIISL